MDGTTNLIRGFQHGAISLALAEGEQVLLGVIYDPFAAELFTAQLLEFRLQRIGIDVRRIPSGGSELLESLALMCAEDLVILFGFSKVSAEGHIILDDQKRTGYRTRFVYKQGLSRGTHRADIHLFVYRGEENEYHSMTTPIAVVDALVLVLSAQIGLAAVDRVETIQNLKTEYGKQL